MMWVDDRTITLHMQFRSKDDCKIYVDELTEWLKKQDLYDHMKNIFDIFIPDDVESKVKVEPPAAKPELPE